MPHATNKKDEEPISAKSGKHVNVCQGITQELQIYLHKNIIRIQFNQIL